VFLEHRARSEVLMLVSSKTNNATPLVMACRYGHYDVAKYLIEECNAEIEQPGAGKIYHFTLFPFSYLFFLVLDLLETGFAYN